MHLYVTGWNSDDSHCSEGSVHALSAAAMWELSAHVYHAPGGVLGGTSSGAHLHRGQSHTEGIKHNSVPLLPAHIFLPCKPILFVFHVCRIRTPCTCTLWMGSTCAALLWRSRWQICVFQESMWSSAASRVSCLSETCTGKLKQHQLSKAKQFQQINSLKLEMALECF